jgi:hypothetical protein
MPNTIFAQIFLFIVISMAMSASISLIWMIFYLFFRRNIKVGFHLFYASFIGGVLGSIPGGIISLLGVLISSFFVESDFISYDINHLIFIAFFSFISLICLFLIRSIAAPE